jgi:hypothetical protein
MKQRLFTAAMLLAFTSGAQVMQKTMKRLPDTGQTQSFTDTFGEDHDYSIHVPTYLDNGDGTITDTITGLMWQKADGGERSFEAAKAYADSLHLAGYSDWRPPMPQELMSIFNHQKNNPAMEVTYFPSTGAEYWWTSVRQSGDSAKIWCGNAGGGIGNHLKTETISGGGTKKFHVKAVRNPSVPALVENHFTDNGDGTVTDNLTQLMWQKNPAASALTWEQALSTAEGLGLAGFEDWRLPNIKELYSIHDPARTNPAADPVFGLQPGGKYWASTSIPGQQGVKAWYFDARFGITTYDLKTLAHPLIVVRGPASVTSASSAPFESEKFSAIPNPASSSGWQFRGLKAGEEIVLLDVCGRVQFRGNPQGYDFRLWPAGMYSAQRSNGETLKILKY